MIRPPFGPILLAALLLAAPAFAAPPPERLAVLARGVNLTNWFRFPAGQDAGFFRAHLGPAAIASLRGWGFTFVRIAVQPEVIARADGTPDPARLALLTEAIGRLRTGGLGVVVEVHPQTWRLETSEPDRQRLLTLWRGLAPALRPFDPRLTFIEPLNEPVFPDAGQWAAFQGVLAAQLRAALPDHTLILTGANWGSLDGLLRLAPVADPNVVYSFHFYEPALLTTLAAFEPGLDQDALARLPFPAADPPACARAAALSRQDRTRAVARFYCAEGWTLDKLRARIEQAGAWGRAHGAAVLLGEFGADPRLADRLAWLRAVRSDAARAAIGWALWGYEDALGLGIGAARPTPDPAVLDTLLR